MQCPQMNVLTGFYCIFNIILVLFGAKQSAKGGVGNYSTMNLVACT
ncbi:hypothetical protein T03_18156 [Trichinella britovi]|uniref:Uncharacterized protein n=1 Tax=Trichinella britovi TaxID=45882 RepID=A0A0V1AAU9_TRIBR|nr:hypothetical protein T03_18156 [Trichinella britovi]